MTVRLSRAEHAAFDGAARAAGVETGGLLRAAALRGLALAVAEIDAGRLKVRARGSKVATALEVREAVRDRGPRPLAFPEQREHPAVAARRAAGLL